MKKPFLWFATSALVMSFVLMAYASTRETKGKGHPASDKVAAADNKSKKDVSRGIASFYGVNTNGTRTASGIPLKDSASTAAHRALPFGTMVRVTNLRNGLSEIVKITDRGPFIKGRIIDVSRNAAEKLDMIDAGIIPVELEVLPGASNPKQPSLTGE